MKFNAVTGGAGRNAREPVSVNEIVVWKLILNCWRLRYNLTDKVIEVFSIILSLDDNISYFSGEGSKRLRSLIPNTSSAELSRIKKELSKANLLIEGTDRGEAYPISWLSSIRRNLRKEGEIEITTTFNVSTKE